MRASVNINPLRGGKNGGGFQNGGGGIPPIVAFLQSMVGFWDLHTYSGSGALLNEGTEGAPGDLTMIGAPTFSGSDENACLTFDGASQAMTNVSDVLAFHASDKFTQFTVGLIMEPTFTTFVSGGDLMGKSANSSWRLRAVGTTLQGWWELSDNTHNASIPADPPMTIGQKKLIVCRTQFSGQMSCKYSDGLLQSQTDPRTGSSVSVEPFSVALTLGGLGFQRFKMYGAFIHRGPVSVQEEADIAAYWGL